MNVQDTARAQLGFWHGTLDGMMGDCSDDVLHRNLADGTTNTIAATYAHAVIGEDTIVHAILQSKQPIFDGGWADKTGVPSPGVPPMMTPEWAASVKIDLPAFKEYAQQVYAATDAYLAGLTEEELARKVPGPAGEQTLGWSIAVVLATHFPSHAGEIAALKGVHGLKGMPF